MYPMAAFVFIRAKSCLSLQTHLSVRGTRDLLIWSSREWNRGRYIRSCGIYVCVYSPQSRSPDVYSGTVSTFCYHAVAIIGSTFLCLEAQRDDDVRSQSVRRKLPSPVSTLMGWDLVMRHDHQQDTDWPYFPLCKHIANPSPPILMNVKWYVPDCDLQSTLSACLSESSSVRR